MWWACAIVAVAVVGCAGLRGATDQLMDRIQDIDLDATLEDMTDCENLADTFVGLVEDTVDGIDAVTAEQGVDPPIADLREIVDELSVSRYYDIAERLGCSRLQAQLGLIDKLRDLEAGTSGGDDFLEEMVDAARQP
jgi:hypothetical protein